MFPSRKSPEGLSISTNRKRKSTNRHAGGPATSGFGTQSVRAAFPRRAWERGIKKIHQKFVERLAEKSKERKIGDSLDPKTEQGPQASQEQMDKILGYVELGQKQGATLLSGGHRHGKKRLLCRADGVRQRERRHGH